MPTLISKSNMMLGMTCEKAVHLAIHKPKLKSRPGPAQQAIFDQGNEVGAKAREYFDAGGALIQAKPWEYPQSIAQTKAAMTSGEYQTIFEAAFSDGMLYSRVDILHRKGGEWHLIEVKASNSVKEEHLTDVAIQAVNCKRAGQKIASYSVMHLNRKSEFPDLSDLFVIQDITAEVEELLPQVEREMDRLILVTEENEPQKPLGRHCDDPYECPFKAHCWKDVPEFSVFELPKVDADRAGQLFADGVALISNLKPEMFPEEEVVQRAIEVTKSGQRYVNAEGLRAALKTWDFPLYFLDFETVMPAIPRYNEAHPYQQITYQFSCHILPSAGATLEHREHLSLGTGDPREELVRELVGAVGPKGSVVSYYSKFEAARMEELAKAYPEHAAALRSIIARLVDPLPLMREFVYDKGFRGSFSIKKVAPSLLGEEFRYDDKEVSDGAEAGVWADRCLRGLARPQEIGPIREKLLAYCRQDTLAMVRLYEWMIAQ